MADSRWKNFGVFLVGGVLGVSAGFVLGIFMFPYIFPPPAAMETVANRAAKTVVAHATFIHADPNDPVHFGKGSATVFRDLVHLEKNFEVGPGPKFHVYLSPNAGIKRNADFDIGSSLDLGRIKAFKGSQSYAIPPGTKLAGYKSLVIWCKAFGVLVSPADLKFAGK